MIKKSLIYSIIFHLIIFSLIFLVDLEKKHRETKPLFVNILSNEQLKNTDKQGKETKILSKLSKESKKPHSNKNISNNLQDTKPHPQQNAETNLQEKYEHKSEELYDKGELPIISSPPSDSTRRKIFDRDIIISHSKLDITSNKAEITFNSVGFKYLGYMQRLKEKIESSWKYPEYAAQRKIQGDLDIKFTIKKNGLLARIVLIRTSGYKILDDYAMKALQDSAPYWPLPEEWDMNELTISGHFLYSLYGTYLQ